MPTFRVIITRDVTESTVIEVEAETKEQAETAAFAKLHASTDTEWEIDEGSWNQSGAYVTGIDQTSN
ncbi:MAG: hypothetical protein HZC25_08750 [Rhodospirillales bacterium]|nr:hypothetical protein [Rhodospirillales bacterium]